MQKNKTILPNTYEQYLIIKKRAIKGSARDSNAQKIKETIDIQSNEDKVKQKKIRQLKTQQEQSQQNETKAQDLKERIIYSEYQQLFDKFNNQKYDAINNKIKEQILKLQVNNPVEPLKVNFMMKDMSIQSAQNLQKLQVQLKKPHGKRKVQEIDLLLCFNKFFSIINREKRFKIYDNCNLLVVQAQETVYKEGELDDYMYIIIKGSVRQYENRQTSYGQKINTHFTTYYEGSNFGQSLLVDEENSKSKRYCATIASEKSYLLQIQNIFYRQLIMNSKEDDFQKKIQSLLSTSIFKETSKIFVIPLLSIMDKHELGYGKVIIRQGEAVRKMYFVSQGNLQVVYIQRFKRSIKHLNIEEPLANFSIKKPQQKKNGKTYSIHQSFYYPKETQNSKQFLYGGKKIVGNQLQYNDHIVFSDLRIGDFFGGKSFLPESDINKKHLNQPNFITQIESKLTVISTAIKTTVYSLDQKKFNSLSDTLQKLIIQGIMNNQYFDQHNIEDKVNSQKQWKKYSQNLVKNIIKTKKQRNYSFRN